MAINKKDLPPLKKARLNNMHLGYQRNEMTYEAVMTDLHLMGIIPKNVLEAFTGRQLAENIQLPLAAQALEEAQDEVDETDTTEL